MAADPGKLNELGIAVTLHELAGGMIFNYNKVLLSSFHNVLIARKVNLERSEYARRLAKEQRKKAEADAKRKKN